MKPSRATVRCEPAKGRLQVNRAGLRAARAALRAVVAAVPLSLSVGFATGAQGAADAANAAPVGPVAHLSPRTVAPSTATSARSPRSAVLETGAARDDEQVARGRYLALAADCAACHKSDDNVPFVGGAPLNSPFGKIYASNITPDPETGIGRYTGEDFERALRRGIARDGKRLYPAMPYASFARLSDADVDALYAYFMRGVQPVRHVVQTTALPFPFNQRWALAIWDSVFVDSKRFTPDPNRDASWNRGAYLVQGAGHCGACHTPREPAYEERGYDESSRHFLTGAVNDNWFAPNLSGQSVEGLGGWSETELARFLSTGRGHGSVAFGAMGPVVSESLQYLEPSDIGAIAHYLKSLPARGASLSRYTAVGAGTGGANSGWAPDDAIELPGAGLYANFCARCHRADGRGVGPFPSLAGSSLVLADDPTSAIRLVFEGGHSAEAAGQVPLAMPAFGGRLNDEQIAQAVAFVRSSWGNRAAPPSPRAVGRVRAALRKQ